MYQFKQPRLQKRPCDQCCTVAAGSPYPSEQKCKQHTVSNSQTVDAISCKVCTFFVKSEVRIKPSKSAETGHPGQGKSHRPRPL